MYPVLSYSIPIPISYFYSYSSIYRDDPARRQFMDSRFEEISDKSRKEYKALVAEVDRLQQRSALLDARLGQFRAENLVSYRYICRYRYRHIDIDADMDAYVL